MEYETEEQQVEAIKKWWKENGMTLIAGLALGLVGVFGYRYYIEQQEIQMASTSDAYESVMSILKQQNDSEKFITVASKYNNDNSGTIYNNLLSLQLAKLAVEAADLATAAQHLIDILDAPQHDTIEHIARIRLARIQLAQGDMDKALALIADAVGDEFRSSYETIRGDIWLAKGDKNKARQAYAAAKENSGSGPVNPNLEMLLIELADETVVAETK